MAEEVLNLVPREEIFTRLKGFQHSLSEEGLDAALIMHNPDLFYYAGTVQDAYLWIPREGAAALVVRKHAEKARCDSPISEIIPIKSVKQLPEIIEGLLPRKNPCIGMEFDVVPVAVLRQWQNAVPGARFEDISSLVWKQRAVKSRFEVEAIRRAGEIVTSTFMEAPDLYEPGMTEQELSALLVQTMRIKGHHGYIRTRGWRSEVYVGGTVSSGASSSTPWPFDGPVAIRSVYPAVTTLNSRRIIAENEPVLIDMLGGFNGYHYDFSRTYVRGRLDDKFIRAHDAAVRIRDALVREMRPGAEPGDLYEQALSMAEDAGFSDAFMNHGMNKVRFVGHGIGLELDEGPVLAKNIGEPLMEGNVIALEPKFIFPGEGGVGVEDTVRVTREGGEILVPCPSEIIAL
ncbi:MAG: M24 family metallopeptidase [Planctomycetota bacterium]